MCTLKLYYGPQNIQTKSVNRYQCHQHQFRSARLQYLWCWCTWDTAVLYYAIKILKFPPQFSPTMCCLVLAPWDLIWLEFSRCFCVFVLFYIFHINIFAKENHISIADTLKYHNLALSHQYMPSNLYISDTKSQNWNVSRLVLQLSLPNPLKPGVKLRMKI